MHKLLFLFLVCFAISLAFAREDKGPTHFKKKDLFDLEPKLFSMKHKSSKFCLNNTTDQAYLTRMLSVIHTLQGNSSYDLILKMQYANFIKYFQDSTNQDLLRNDCGSFLKGLKAAKKADQEMEGAQRKLARNIEKQLKQVARDVNNGKEFDELDS